MNKLASFFESERGKRIKNLIIGLGASVVLIGALFKLQHWPYASQFLIIGMCTEAFIFALLGILPPHKDYYWEKIYPELDIAPDEEELQKEHETAVHGSLTQQFDSLLDQGGVDTELIKRLGDNLNKLGDNLTKLSDVSDAASATSDYSEKAQQAAGALDEMRLAYNEATKAANLLASGADETKKYHEQVQQVSKNLSQLNAIYELELQDTNNHLKTMNKFYGSLTQAMDNLHESLEDTQKYKTEMNGLAKNLSSLNSIYGNMLTAMQMGGAGNGR
jgi:gliding motility-associated protein GldL